MLLHLKHNAVQYVHANEPENIFLFLQDASDLMRYEQTISKLSLALAVAAGICLILLISVIALLIRRKNLDD